MRDIAPPAHGYGPVCDPGYFGVFSTCEKFVQ